VGQELPPIISAFIEELSNWARSQPDIEAVALVGSYARNAAKADSDVDLVILTPVANRYLRDRSWLSLFGRVTEYRDEDYGRVRSVRTFYESGLVVEYGFAKPDWAATPIDAGTMRVVSQGMRVLHDPQRIIARMQQKLRPNREQET
jgi:predicted nucleotidyltransferase